jgi:hypothetical protein
MEKDSEMKKYIGSCVENPFKSVNRLTEIIDSGKRIGLRKFMQNCEIAEDTIRDMKKFSHDYMFHCSEKFDIMWYTHSCIEYFYK